jgi:fatty-acyl-CoA synthase
MLTDDLHRPLYCADILINALNQDSGRPLLHLLDGPTLTVNEVRDAISRFAQALRSLAITAGTRVGLLSSNRPEVLQAPKTIEFIDSIPQTAVGKPDKKALRAKFGQTE